ncbi:MAG: PEP-CTERM sorting domain-containing protein [Planctomycetales bacterium]|nr:PEP-CTERM sorting domain-containing protein [Planctomycetales bacterium]
MKTTISTSLFFLALLGICMPASAARYLVDFGRNDVATGGGQGAITASPDSNGNYWNNFNKEAFNSDTGNLDVPDNAAISGLIDDANGASGIGIQLLDSTGNNEWEANGALNGGLLGPDSNLLGELAIETATRDYFFTTQPSASFVLNGLNPLATYDLEFFATRDTGGYRATQYRATDANGAMLSAILQTSGGGAGSAAHPNGNDDDTVALLGLVPDGSNSITIDMLTNAGGFSYVGIMSITENTVPEPASLALLGLGGLAFAAVRRRASR